jgi:ATP-dependent protease ClpP protease subunit
MLAEIKITNAKPGVTVIDIEGVIGVPEEWQFDEPAGKVATYRTFKETLARIAKIRSEEVVVNIRSTGGDVGDALLIYDALSSLDALITTRCYGYVASAATIIAQTASDDRRYISANSLYLIHNAVSNCEGNASDFRQKEQLLTKTDERIASIYASRSGRPAEDFASLMAENNGSGRWLSPEETLSLGLADRITDAASITDPAIQTTEELSAKSAAKVRNKGLRRRIGEMVERLTSEKATPMPANSEDADALRWQQHEELEKLRSKVTSLEAENAQLRAAPTPLKTKEDPSPTEGHRSANANAYLRDVEGFRL